MKNQFFISLLSFASVLASCNSTNNKKETTKVSYKTADLINTEVPSILKEDSLIQKHIATQFWKKFPFNDTTIVNSNFEEALSIYLNLLPQVSISTIDKAQQNLMNLAKEDSASYKKVFDRIEHYLYDPNSPYRSEELFKPILENALASNIYSADEKIRIRYLLDDIHKNEVGTKAADFTYKTIDKKISSLYKVKSDFTVLFFNNPDCHTCAEIKKELSQNPLIKAAIEKNKLKILALYPDEDLETWKQHVADYPKTWINAYDPKLDIKNKELYNLRAIPCLYLLSTDKTVLLKDCTLHQLLYYLSNNINID
ncbi:MAG: DUF5106 domain-containing protein [Tannerellaceae bacterium]